MYYKELINIIILLFPLTCYIIYLGQNKYSSRKDKQNKDLFLDLALLTSLYLYIKYVINTNNYNMIILMNIPLLISIIKERKVTTIILSIFIIITYHLYFNYGIIHLLSEYILYYLLCNMTKDKKNIIKIVLYFTIIKIFIPILYTSQIIIADRLVFLILSILVLYLFQIGESIMDMNLDIKKLKKDKIINDSIFKITHEIKNPIAVCKGYLDMFDANDIEKSEKYSKVIKDEIERTLELLKDFLNFSKIDIQKEEIDISMLLDEIYDKFCNYIQASGINIEYQNIDDEIYVDGDYKRLKQVLINLIKNSMEAIKEKNNSNGNINLTGKIENSDYVITLLDNGVGIDSNTMKDIYKPFFTTKQDGTGLGVCFSKEVIDAHNGDIKYYTDFGKWTKVIIKLPLKNSD